MGVVFELNGESAVVRDLVSVQALDRSFSGVEKKEKGKFELELSAEEALYLLDVRNAECKGPSGKLLSFNDIAKKADRSRQFLARYFCYKDWRDRGLIASQVL